MEGSEKVKEEETGRNRPRPHVGTAVVPLVGVALDFILLGLERTWSGCQNSVVVFDYERGMI